MDANECKCPVGTIKYNCQLRKTFASIRSHLRPISAAIVFALLIWAAARALPRQTTQAENTQPLTGLAGIRVPAGFTVEKVAGPDLASYGMFGHLDDRGRLFVCASTGPNTMTTEEMLKNPSYVIRLLEDNDGDGIYDKSKIFADRIPLPAGAYWYRGSLYVAASPDFVRFNDTNDDGIADSREIILTGWTLNVNGATLHGPFLGPDGWFYLTDARRGYKIKTKEGTILEGKGPRIWRCRPDGTGLEWVSAGGFDNPVELVFTPAGEIIGTMTYFRDPAQGQRDALMHWVEGGVYPKPHPVIEELKRTGDLMPVMTKFARIAPSGLIRYRSSSFGPEYRGNLFSAQFNTHRVQRHILMRDGATFRTEDEDFLTSVDPDFHPTDVVEDADGSLLVIDTGGWFIKGCPLSRVARPEIRGGIYRIRKRDAARIPDPRGRNLNLQNRSALELASYLKDFRPAVRDKATELLTLHGGAAVDPLIRLLKSSAESETRCSALFTLFWIANSRDVPPGRLYSPAQTRANQAIRAALSDSDLQVRIAAARSVGMARDALAVNLLTQMVKKDKPPVRRQAAIALAQIGDKRATEALIAASANPEDRFVEHAIIYALMRLSDPGALARALKNPSPKVRKAALIASDQMENSPLKAEELLPALSDEDKELRNAALWIISHHPQWSGNVVAFLRGRLRAPEMSADEMTAVSEVLVSLCQRDEIQALVAELLADANTPPDKKIVLLDSVDRCSIKELPENWIQPIGNQLQDRNLKVRSRAVALIRSRQITRWADLLHGIAASDTEPEDLRTAALGALVLSRPRLSEPQFRFLLGNLQAGKEAPLRLSAAQVLGRARLADRLLLHLAREYLPQADPLVLPGLLEAFRGNSNEEVGQALVAALMKTPQGIDSFAEKHLQDLFSKFPTPVQRSAKPLLEHLQKMREAGIERLQDLESKLNGGDVARGLKIFFGQKVACASCHTIGKEGGQVGPDLTSVGAIRSRHDILESIIFPSASFVREHETYRVETANDIYSGILGEQGPDAIVLITGPDSKIRVPRDKILSMQPSNVSLMPEGLDAALTQSELADLIAFLEAQR